MFNLIYITKGTGKTMIIKNTTLKTKDYAAPTAPSSLKIEVDANY